ncbi:MAG: ABC transporter substrate-binding protein [Bacteroidales bacterium]|nr:ABC transporter substrate-binding protein [Bacteroidales bacterium]
MTKLGYIEGKSIVYDLQKLNAEPIGEKRVVKKFVDDKVDLILAFPTEPAVTAKAFTLGTDIPVVFAMSGIEGNNLVNRVDYPGKNITGVRYPEPELTVKRFEILRELAPHAKRIYIIYDPDYPIAPYALEQLRAAATSSGITLVEDTVRSVQKIQVVLSKRAVLSDIGVDAILIMPEILTQSPDAWAIISNFATEHKLPIGGSAAFEADSGAIFSYIPDLIEVGEMSAILVDKIFNGTSAGSIMVVTPHSHLRLNNKVIQKLDLKANEGLLSIADEIIR